VTPIATFLIAAAGLLAVILAILLAPLLRSTRAPQPADRPDANLSILREQLDELEQDYRNDALSESDHLQATAELKRRLLDETPNTAPATIFRAEKATALALLIAIPLAAGAGYLILGSPQALAPQNLAQQSATTDSQQIDEMLNKLVEKLKNNPDDQQGWMMLARSYKVLGRYPEAAEAYTHLGERLETDAALLADYAEVLARANKGTLEGKPTELLAKALKIDPDEPQALFLAGAAASDRQDFTAAAEYWERLLPQLEPGSEEAKSLQAAITHARAFGTGDKQGAKR